MKGVASHPIHPLDQPLVFAHLCDYDKLNAEKLQSNWSLQDLNVQDLEMCTINLRYAKIPDPLD